MGGIHVFKEGKGNIGQDKKMTALVLTLAMMLSLLPASLFGSIVATAASGANPRLDLLLSGFNIFGGNEFSRSNITNLITSEGKTLLEQQNQTLGFMRFPGGNKGSYRYYASQSIESLITMHGKEESTNSSWGAGYERPVKVGLGLGIIKAETTLKSSASARFTKIEQKTTGNKYYNSYENFFSIMEIRRELGRNHIIVKNSLRTHNHII